MSEGGRENRRRMVWATPWKIEDEIGVAAEDGDFG